MIRTLTLILSVFLVSNAFAASVCPIYCPTALASASCKLVWVETSTCSCTCNVLKSDSVTDDKAIISANQILVVPGKISDDAYALTPAPIDGLYSDPIDQCMAGKYC
jgi:hypothetical protein